jgi:hypothetical protein
MSLRSVVTRPAVAVSVACGLAHAVGLLAFAFLSQGYEFTGEGVWSLLVPVWTVVGLFLLAAIPVYLLVQQSLVVPTAVVCLNLALAVRAELSIGPGDPLGLQFVAWVVPLGVALLLGGVEYLVRSQFGLLPPKALVG